MLQKPDSSESSHDENILGHALLPPPHRRARSLSREPADSPPLLTLAHPRALLPHRLIIIPLHRAHYARECQRGAGHGVARLQHILVFQPGGSLVPPLRTGA